MPNISALIFDLGGVLIDWNPAYLYSKIFSREEDMNYFLENICTMEWNEEQDAGRSINDGVAILIDKYPQYKYEIEAYYNRWTEMLGGCFDENVELLYRLKKIDHIQLYALTNWSAETFTIARNKYPFLGLFEGIVVSGFEKTKKPDKKIFDVLLDRYNLNPESSLFIDDNSRNIESASSLGIHTIHYSPSVDLVRKIEQYI